MPSPMLIQVSAGVWRTVRTARNRTITPNRDRIARPAVPARNGNSRTPMSCVNSSTADGCAHRRVARSPTEPGTGAVIEGSGDARGLDPGRLESHGGQRLADLLGQPRC